ncbi:MAG: hypothetical protein IKC87_07490 [Clostridia bacterium]|nr:hypothetical protein [Clostridia bacterium]
MNKTWNKKWKTLLIWISAYTNFIAFMLVGGYFVVKSEDDELCEITKRAFIVTMIFTALSAFLTVYNYVGGMVDGYYASAAYDLYSILNALVGIGRIAVFGTFAVSALVKKDDAPAPTVDAEADVVE